MTPARHGRTAAVLSGIGAWLPPRVVTNDELATRLDTSDAWIRSRTGIGQRHFIEAGMSTGSLAVEAGARALKSANLDSVDVVVLATTTPDQPCPATAPLVAARLGMTAVPAFDVGAVCAGFVYALSVAAGLIVSGTVGNALVIGADAFSTLLDPTDRGSGVIFGDGAGAVVLRSGEPDEPGALGPFDLGTDGEHAELIEIPAGGSAQRAGGVPTRADDHYFTMQGRAVFKHAVLRMTASVQRAVRRARWTMADVDRVAAHQANSRILHALADQLGMAHETFLSNIDRVGNTAAASVPLLLNDAVADGTLRPGQRVVLTSFGGGLAWGSTTLRWPELDVV
ncbi:beta-ketoacyl-ACP synthase III [Streptomyces odontomachi]|uniref:beta-ketoacyl-ACP synthase III n=1 Tax=Streptomyces odontomachi TaxID=2944940 RepID=UPI00210D6814|nr:beta-ketoacyl-ACP synthase III [Streptomyces sp. ODS25]